MIKKVVLLSILIAVSSMSLLASAQELPLYLAIVAQEDAAKQQVFSFIQQSLTQLIIQFPKDSDTILEDFKKLFISSGPQTPWQYPDSWHTTVLYIGGDANQLNTPYYQNFHPGQIVDLETFTFVYVPGRIICGPVFPKNVLISNQCPHMTLMMGQWSAVASNYVLQALFTGNGPLKQQYEDNFFASPEGTLIEKYSQMNINNELVDVFILKVNQASHVDHIDLQGVETKVYENQQSFA